MVEIQRDFQRTVIDNQIIRGEADAPFDELDVGTRVDLAIYYMQALRQEFWELNERNLNAKIEGQDLEYVQEELIDMFHFLMNVNIFLDVPVEPLQAVFQAEYFAKEVYRDNHYGTISTYLRLDRAFSGLLKESVPWKKWKNYDPAVQVLVADLDGEARYWADVYSKDMMVSFMHMADIWDLSGDDLFKAYIAKQDINRERQKTVDAVAGGLNREHDAMHSGYGWLQTEYGVDPAELGLT